LPRYSKTAKFRRDYDNLTPDQRKAFKEAVRDFVEDLKAGQRFRPELRVKRVQGTRGVWELTWADDGRATTSRRRPQLRPVRKDRHRPASGAELEGCETQCIELTVDVPAGTVPASDRTGTVYEVNGRFQIACCDHGGAVVGYEAKEEYQWYTP
jgi:hypothetical protein